MTVEKEEGLLLHCRALLHAPTSHRQAGVEENDRVVGVMLDDPLHALLEVAAHARVVLNNHRMSALDFFQTGAVAAPWTARLSLGVLNDYRQRELG